MKWILRHAIAGILVLVSAGCATYSDWAGQMEHEVAVGNTAGALDILEKHLDGKRDQVLYLLNRAMLLRMAGRFEASNRDFEAAKIMIDKLSAISVSEQGGAFSINEMTRSYKGEPFDRILIHVYAALNYLELDRPQDARVEALQLDGLLNELAARDFPEMAVARYVAALVYETLHEWDDALIDYRKAYQAYGQYPGGFHVSVPAQLKYDLLRLTRRVGLRDEYERYREQWGKLDDPELDERMARGELIFLLHSGLAPLKFSENVTAVTRDGELVTLSMPYYIPRAVTVTSALVRENGRSVEAEMFEDINAVAQYTLDKQKPALLARAIARAVLKHQATEAAGDRDDALGLIVNMAGVLSERADTRSWSTLPGRIYLARLPLAPGNHKISVDLRDPTGALVARKDFSFTLKAGGKRFITLHWVDERDLMPTSAHAVTVGERH